MSDTRYINLQVTPQKWENQYFGDFEAPIALYPAPSRPTPTPTKTPTPTPTPSVTASVTPTSTPAPTSTPTVTPSISVSPTASITPTPSVTQTLQTPTPTPTNTITPSITPTNTITPSITPTITPSITASVTPTFTPTSTETPTPTTTSTETPTPTPTITPSPSALPNPYYLLAENTDELLTEAGENIDYRTSSVQSYFLDTYTSTTVSNSYNFTGTSSGNQGLIVIGFGGEYVPNTPVTLNEVIINGETASIAAENIGGGGINNKQRMTIAYHRVTGDTPLDITINYADDMEEQYMSIYRLNYVTFDQPYSTDSKDILAGSTLQLDLGTVPNESAGVVFSFWDWSGNTSYVDVVLQDSGYNLFPNFYAFATGDKEFITGQNWTPTMNVDSEGIGFKTFIGAVWR